MSQTIVVPIALPEQDPDRISLAAVPLARNLAERCGSGIVLVAAADVVPIFDPISRTLVTPTDEVRGHLLDEARSVLTAVATQLPDIPVEIVVQWGHPVNVIRSVLENAAEPMLVMASHARHGLHRILRGSIAFQLVHEAPCPVVLVRRTGSVDRLPGDRSIRTILAPLDRSPFAEHAVEVGLAALGRPDVRVHLLHVVEPLPYGIHALDEVIDAVRPGVERYLEEFAARLTDRGYRVTVEVRQGRPVDLIKQAAVEQEADLVVMATHGQTGLGRRLLGCTAERLLAESPVPILLVRPDEKAVAAARATIATLDTERQEALGAPPPALWDVRADAVMTTPAIASDRETPLVEIVETMLGEGIGCVPVVDRDNQLVGIVTESDFVGGDRFVPLAAYQVPRCFQIHLTDEMLDRIYAAGRELTADQIMSQPVVTVTEDESVGAVVATMRCRNVNRVPVVRDGVPVGIIARRDLLKLLIPPQNVAVVTGLPNPADG